MYLVSKMSRRALAGVIAGVIGLGAVGAAAAATSSSGIKVKSKTIAVLDVTDASESILQLNAIAMREIKALGYKAKFYNANGNPQTIIQDATAIVNSHPSAVMDVSVDASQFRPQLQQLNADHIPVCAFTSGGSAAANSLYQVIPAENEYHMGYLLGQYIAKTVAAPKVIILANPQNAAGVDRGNGIVAGLKLNKNATVVFTTTVDFANPVTSAAQGVAAGLAKYPDANAIIPVFDFSTTPAVKAVQQGNTQAKVYGFYVASDTAPYLRMGAKSPIAAVVDNSTVEGPGPCLDQLLNHWQKGKPFVKYPLGLKTNAVPFIYDVVTPANVGKLVPKGSTSQFTVSGESNAWIAKWKKEFPAK